MPDFLYIHIPFCVKKCFYCDFLSVPYDATVARQYIDALCKELYLKRNAAKSLKAIYIGGGTPSLLTEECYAKLFQCLKDNFHFSRGIEITVEANPGTINESRFNTLLFLGVNRISIGIQSFIDDELKMLGRIHTAEDAVRAVESAKTAGLKNISMDLIYGIPGQTKESWQKTIAESAALAPHHISAYELTPERGTALYELVQSKEIRMADEDLTIDMYNYAIDRLVSCGYNHYEISNFALHGFRCIHNLNYWDRGEYMGIGAGAHSFINGLRSRNTMDINKYIENFNKGIASETENDILTTENSLQEFIFLGLRKTEGIRLIESRKIGLNIPELCSGLIDEGYLETDSNYIRLTKKGLVISNTIIVCMFEKLGL